MEEKNIDRIAAYEQARARSKKMKKKLILILLAILATAIVFFGAVIISDLLTRPKAPSYEYGEEQFAPTYQGDIMENEEYLGLDRGIKYCSDPSGYGITESIVEENRKDFDTGVLFLYDYMQTIIAGDHNAYNACFNDHYYKENLQKGFFSPQMVYNTLITYQTTVLDGNDKLVTYRLEYMIHQNDGTFRKDILSDASRPQYLTLRISSDGNAIIEKLVTLYESVQQ